jgi:uncharacterized membrane protein
MAKRTKNSFVCPICNHHRPERERTHGEVVRPALAEVLQRDHPEWSSDSAVCASCLADARARYVTKVLEEEKGALTHVEQDVVDSIRASELLASNPDEEFAEQLSTGQRIADRIASVGGSWTFILSFGAVLTVWIAVNTHAIMREPFDPYPFILLNLVLSCLAALQAPVIMMSQNRQETKDRLRATNDYRVNLKAELEIRQLNEKVDQLMNQQWHRLLEIQRLQMDMMEQLVRRAGPPRSS